MEVPIFLVADCANISDNGKLNIMGIFQTIYAPGFPIMHPKLVLILKLVPEFDEYGVEHDVRIELVDGDGKLVFRLDFQVKFGVPVEGKKPETIQILELNGIGFKHPGKFQIVLFIKSQQKARLGIEVVQTPLVNPNMK